MRWMALRSGFLAGENSHLRLLRQLVRLFGKQQH
jgi:hypothetical protein